MSLELGKRYNLVGGGEALMYEWVGAAHVFVWATLIFPGHERHGKPTCFATENGKYAGSATYKIGDAIIEPEERDLLDEEPVERDLL